MMNQQDIQKTIRDFIHNNFIFDQSIVIDNTQSLLGSGIIDSTGVLELIGYLEEYFQLKFNDDELIAENFDTVDKLTAFLQNKLNKQ